MEKFKNILKGPNHIEIEHLTKMVFWREYVNDKNDSKIYQTKD